MVDITIELSDDVYERLVAVAASGGIEPEHLVRQIVAVGVGVNTSSKDDPFSSVLLRNRPEDLLSLAEAGPVFVRNMDHGDFVLITDERYEQGSSST